MAETFVKHSRMTLLEICRAYPDQFRAAIEQYNKESETTPTNKPIMQCLCDTCEWVISCCHYKLGIRAVECSGHDKRSGTA